MKKLVIALMLLISISSFKSVEIKAQEKEIETGRILVDESELAILKTVPFVKIIENNNQRKIPITDNYNSVVVYYQKKPYNPINPINSVNPPLVGLPGAPVSVNPPTAPIKPNSVNVNNPKPLPHTGAKDYLVLAGTFSILAGVLFYKKSKKMLVLLIAISFLGFYGSDVYATENQDLTSEVEPIYELPENDPEYQPQPIDEKIYVLDLSDKSEVEVFSSNTFSEKFLVGEYYIMRDIIVGDNLYVAVAYSESMNFDYVYSPRPKPNPDNGDLLPPKEPQPQPVPPSEPQPLPQPIPPEDPQPIPPSEPQPQPQPAPYCCDIDL